MTKNNAAIDTGMVLAAGLGTRMQSLTHARPKPLIALAGKTLIDRVLDHLNKAGVSRIVVNTHYMADMLEAQLAKREDIVISPEPYLLETGGGVSNALPLLGENKFFVINSDAVWLDGPTRTLDRMMRAWNDDEMDALLLFQRTVAVHGAAGRGDFFLDSEGYASRRQERGIAPFLFAGVQILHPRLFETAPGGAFSLNILYDRAQETSRLHGIVHDGEWFHVGTPEQREIAEYEIFRGNDSVNNR